MSELRETVVNRHKIVALLDFTTSTNDYKRLK